MFCVNWYVKIATEINTFRELLTNGSKRKHELIISLVMSLQIFRTKR